MPLSVRHYQRQGALRACRLFYNGYLRTGLRHRRPHAIRFLGDIFHRQIIIVFLVSMYQ